MALATSNPTNRQSSWGMIGFIAVISFWMSRLVSAAAGVLPFAACFENISSDTAHRHLRNAVGASRDDTH
ncbi:hypothetical protein PHMEG_00036711 [Phytophthora megakarya]|uniref:Uncharacterized protein n=1 Tax=Phytophthora megakarya TaxID=4795 RepID=A0A225ULE1_9STRA|nr:hypothetical protein PHMEG_00036711 [Phytophthora megakarya]